MVIQEKKTKGDIRICVYLRKLNDASLHDPFPTPFTDEMLDNVGGQEVYSFADGFSGYHQIRIHPEDRYKTTFATEWGSFQYTLLEMKEVTKNISIMQTQPVKATAGESSKQLVSCEEILVKDRINTVLIPPRSI